eukprot:3555876-Amphidinium_carterae.1
MNTCLCAASFACWRGCFRYQTSADARLVLLEALARAWKEQIWGPKAVLLVQEIVDCHTVQYEWLVQTAVQSRATMLQHSVSLLDDIRIPSAALLCAPFTSGLCTCKDLLAQVGGTAAIEAALVSSMKPGQN